MTYRSAKYKLICTSLLGVMQLRCETSRPNPQDAAGSTSGTRAAPTATAPATRGAARPPASCPKNKGGVPSGHSVGAPLHEISGIVASRESPGLLWVHNDSGDGAHVYALTTEGTHIGTATIPATAQDWEDIALKASPGAGNILYIADIGDNLAARDTGVAIHRFAEPTRAALDSAFPQAVAIAEVETMTLRFPEGPVDAEALLVDPLSDEIVLITKPRMQPPKVYSVTRYETEATLTFEGAITSETSGQYLHLVTGADVSADGRWILIRTYTSLVLFHRAPGMRLAQALLGHACPLVPPTEQQGEAVAFLWESTHNAALSTSTPPRFVTISEGVEQSLTQFDWDRGDPTTK